MLGLLVATCVFTVTFATVLQQSIQGADDAELGRQDAYAAEAAQIADLLIFEPGVGWFSAGPACIDGVLNTAAFTPERVGRLGLGKEPCTQNGNVLGGIGRVSFEKMENLYRASMASDPLNLAVDYEDARRGFALGDRNFHVRSWPVLQSTADLLAQGRRDPNLRPLYIADYTATSNGAPPYVLGRIESADSVRVYLNITNNGAVPTVFDALFELDLKADSMAFNLHTPVLAAGASGNITFTLLKTSDWEWKNANRKYIAVEVHDRVQRLFSTTLDLSDVTMSSASQRRNVFVEAEKLTFLRAEGTAVAKYYYKAFNGKGQLTSFSDWTMRTLAPDGTVLQTDVLPTTDEGVIQRSFTSTGTFRAALWNDALTAQWNSDVINVVDVQPERYGGSGSFRAEAPVAAEAAYIAAVMERFDPYVFGVTYATGEVPYAPGGDVYPDVRTVMNNDLRLALTDEAGQPTLAKYSTIIVGSNVDHNAMTSAAAKVTIRDWVLAGGTLIVFGSSDQSVNWLQPLFHSSLDSASGGVATPDTKHPALTTPNTLDYSSFKYSTEWNYNAGAGDAFTHVVTAGQVGDLLGVSNPGAFGDGKVLLSAWRPYDLTANQAQTCALPIQPGADCQALFLLHNLVTLSYRELYLDYGPLIPANAAVGVQMRVALVHHPELEADVEVRFIVYVF